MSSPSQVSINRYECCTCEIECAGPFLESEERIARVMAIGAMTTPGENPLLSPEDLERKYELLEGWRESDDDPDNPLPYPAALVALLVKEDAVREENCIKYFEKKEKTTISYERKEYKTYDDQEYITREVSTSGSATETSKASDHWLPAVWSTRLQAYWNPPGTSQGVTHTGGGNSLVTHDDEFSTTGLGDDECPTETRKYKSTTTKMSYIGPPQGGLLIDDPQHTGPPNPDDEEDEDEEDESFEDRGSQDIWLSKRTIKNWEGVYAIIPATGCEDYTDFEGHVYTICDTYATTGCLSGMKEVDGSEVKTPTSNSTRGIVFGGGDTEKFVNKGAGSIEIASTTTLSLNAKNEKVSYTKTTSVTYSNPVTLVDGILAVRERAKAEDEEGEPLSPWQTPEGVKGSARMVVSYDRDHRNALIGYPSFSETHIGADSHKSCPRSVKGVDLRYRWSADPADQHGDATYMEVEWTEVFVPDDEEEEEEVIMEGAWTWSSPGGDCFKEEEEEEEDDCYFSDWYESPAPLVLGEDGEPRLGEVVVRVTRWKCSADGFWQNADDPEFHRERRRDD